MKKFFLLLFAISVATSYAQNQPWNWSEKPSSLSLAIGAPSTYSFIKTRVLGLEPRRLNYFGSFSVSYDYNILRWMAVGVRGSYEGWQYKGNDYQNCHRASMLMTIRFTYINRENVQLYSGVGLGPSYMFGKDGESYNYMSFAGYVTPIGIHVGAKNVYALAELGLGTEALMAVGVGFKL